VSKTSHLKMTLSVFQCVANSFTNVSLSLVSNTMGIYAFIKRVSPILPFHSVFHDVKWKSYIQRDNLDHTRFLQFDYTEMHMDLLQNQSERDKSSDCKCRDNKVLS